MAAESPLFPCACGGQRPRAAVPPPTGLEPVLPEEPEEFRRTRFAAPGRACRHGGNRSPAAADRPAAGHDQDLLVGSHVVVEDVVDGDEGTLRSEEHTSELQSLMRISYAVFCLKQKKQVRHR